MYTLTKTQVELYKLRADNGYWADITLDSGNRCGRINIASDFGNYSNFWPACGESFKAFLVGLNVDYAADKFGASKFFDLEGTLTIYKAGIKDALADLNIDDKKASALNKECDELAQASDVEEFKRIMWQCHNLMEFYDHHPELNYTIAPLFRRFWNEVWPGFIEHLKIEIKAKKEVTSDTA